MFSVPDCPMSPWLVLAVYTWDAEWTLMYQKKTESKHMERIEASDRTNEMTWTWGIISMENMEHTESLISPAVVR